MLPPLARRFVASSSRLSAVTVDEFRVALRERAVLDFSPKHLNAPLSRLLLPRSQRAAQHSHQLSLSWRQNLLLGAIKRDHPVAEGPALETGGSLASDVRESPIMDQRAHRD